MYPFGSRSSLRAATLSARPRSPSFVSSVVASANLGRDVFRDVFPRLNPRREVREHRELLAYMYHRASYRYLRLNTSHMLEHALNLYLIETRIDAGRTGRVPRERPDGRDTTESANIGRMGGAPAHFCTSLPGAKKNA